MPDFIEKHYFRSKMNFTQPQHMWRCTIDVKKREYLTYVAAVGDNADSMEMRYEDENIWLTQKMMAALYDVDVRTINEHIMKIFEDDELEEKSTIRKFRIVQTEGNRQAN